VKSTNSRPSTSDRFNRLAIESMAPESNDDDIPTQGPDDPPPPDEWPDRWDWENDKQADGPGCGPIIDDDVSHGGSSNLGKPP
jgi:hypothetical protein